METKTALVWSDCTVELNAVATVYLNFTVVIYPRNTEHDNTFWFYNAFQKSCVLII